MKLIVLILGDAGAIIKGNFEDFYEGGTLDFYYYYVLIVRVGLETGFLGDRIFYCDIIMGFKPSSCSERGCSYIFYTKIKGILFKSLIYMYSLSETNSLAFAGLITYFEPLLEFYFSFC